MRSERILLGIAILSCLLLAGCAGTGSQETLGFCGDGLCSYDEKETCSADCRPVFETKNDPSPDITWIEEQRQERENYPDTSPTVPIEIEPTIVVDKPITTTLPEIGFRVASRYNLLSIGENITGVMGTLNGMHLRQILRGAYLRSNTEAFGPRAAFYEQFLTLRSGRVVFGLEEDTEIVSTFLEYKEGEPILEYYIRVNGGIFKFFQGQVINFLGHDYVLTEISNQSILLTGVNSEDEFILRNSHSSIINGDNIAFANLNVTMGVDFIKIIVSADEDIRMLQGELLTDFLPRTFLLTNRIDLEYAGLTDSPSIDISLKRSGSNYKLIFTNNIGMNYSVPIARVNPVISGDDQNRLIFQEADGNNDYNIGAKDYLLITNNREIGGITNVLRLREVQYDDELISFEDLALEKFWVKYDGEPGKNAYADMKVHGVNHRIYVGKGERISMDQNGDGKISKANVPIIAGGNSLIRMALGNGTIDLKFVTPKGNRENSNQDLETQIIISTKGISIPEKSLLMSYDQARDQLVGMTDYGTLMILRRNVDEDDQLATDLLINQPLIQRFAEVILKAYE